ncbi:hypothetical protein CIRMBP1304_00780 [Enterococcus cecorum]|nr:hypothetical protein CIRMBP1304_00780 [Enterococcus cecorum]
MNIVNDVIEAEFVYIPSQTKYWFVRAGIGAEYFLDFKINNYIAIGDNEVAISELDAIPSKYRVTQEILKDKYKEIFNETYLKLLTASDNFKSKTRDEQAEEIEKIKRKSTIASTKTFNFIEKMNVGDIILVPSKKSESFLIGIIISSHFGSEINHEKIDDSDDYNISDYEKKRRVLWLKDISFSELPEKLVWIQSSQRAIYNISDYSHEINSILYSQYIFKGNAYLRINVETENKISNADWLEYQQIIYNNSNNKANEIYQKNNIQSPGSTILETIFQNWQVLVCIALSLFVDSDIEIKGIKLKLHGPLSFLIPGSKNRREHEENLQQLEIKEKQINIELLEKDLDIKKEEAIAKKLQNELSQLELSEKNKILQDVLKNKELFKNKEYISSNKFKTEKTRKQQETLKKMKVREKTIGTEISPQTQKVSLSLMNFEQKKAKEK